MRLSSPQETKMSKLALPAALATTLDDKYTATSGRVFLTGTQALIRLPMLQRAEHRRFHLRLSRQPARQS
jgi:hypothetical protein